MNRRTKGVLLIGGLAAVTAVVATFVALTGAVARVLDPGHACETGFSTLVNCNYHWSSITVSQGTPIFPSSSPPKFQPTYTDVTSWSVVDCPQNAIAKRVLCATPAGAQAASDDSDTGLPLPKPWVLRTAKSSRFITSVHVETPLDLASVLGFYRASLGTRGWKEDSGAVVESDRAVIPFTTSDGPALLRLIHQDDRTIADLSRRKPADADAGILPQPGQVRLRLGNTTDEAAVITINGQSIKLAARAGRDLADDTDAGRKSPGSAEIDLPPGKYKVAIMSTSAAVQNREFEVAAGETWGLLVGSAGVLLPVHLY